MYCGKCGTQLSDNVNFCGKCGTPVHFRDGGNELALEPVQQETAYTEVNSKPLTQKPTYKESDCTPVTPEFIHTTVDFSPVSTRSNVAFRPVCLIAIIACTVLWLIGPFVAVNLITLGDQPTALQFITDDITYLGDLTNNPEYWAAFATMVCLVVCFVCALVKKYTISRIMAIIALIPMVLTLVHVVDWAGGDLEDMFEIAGIGYWGILAGLIVIIFDSKNKKNT